MNDADSSAKRFLLVLIHRRILCAFRDSLIENVLLIACRIPRLSCLRFDKPVCMAIRCDGYGLVPFLFRSGVDGAILAFVVL